MKFLQAIKNLYKNWKKKREFKKKLEELKKRDPFIYKNFQYKLIFRIFIRTLVLDNSVVAPL